ncbi:hypothetical protein B0H10DRAFT_2207569 [Mycena sp. CBHHK59/15]|nr:hypothetical protein B0H10DRAFT_2207569 [Mycena sp. CBHHK59/15]
MDFALNDVASDQALAPQSTRSAWSSHSDFAFDAGRFGYSETGMTPAAQDTAAATGVRSRASNGSRGTGSGNNDSIGGDSPIITTLPEGPPALGQLNIKAWRYLGQSDATHKSFSFTLKGNPTFRQFLVVVTSRHMEIFWFALPTLVVATSSLCTSMRALTITCAASDSKELDKNLKPPS